MTIREVSDQIYDLTGGKINEQLFCKERLYKNIQTWFKDCEHNKIKNGVVIHAELMDGGWYCLLTKYSNNIDGYDYYIPETREDEHKLILRFMGKQTVIINL